MLHSAVIEVRQHLCCANVFLKFKKSLTDTESLKITVDETKVKLQNPACSVEIFVNQYFSILAGTFSNLIVDADNASFRISFKDIQLTGSDDCYTKTYIQINLAENEDAAVVCCNCDSVLAPTQKYDKIREFPSGTIDVSEFFCHHGPRYEDVLIPSTGNIYYGFQFIVLNGDVIEKTIREKESHIYCRRCLRYLGETMFNGKAVKLWSDSIRFNLKGQILDIFASNEKSQIYNLILKAIEDTSLPATEPLLRNMHFTKVLLRASFPNRQQQYFLVHILEKHLPVLTTNKIIEDKPSKTEDYPKTYELKQTKAFKLLYRLIVKDEHTNNKGSASGSPILQYWQQDINILKMTISPSLFSVLNKELSKNVKVLPEIYRVNNDEFLLSYIFY